MKVVKVSMNLSTDVVDIVRALAKKRGVTMTAVFKQAIVDMKFFVDAIKDGSKILVEDKRGKMRQVIYR